MHLTSDMAASMLVGIASKPHACTLAHIYSFGLMQALDVQLGAACVLTLFIFYNPNPNP